jgi:HD-like signal output (HDOD) protein
VDRIDWLLDRVAEVCPLPKTSEQLLELTRSDRSSIPEVAKVIATDPALAAAVLRIANSAVFGGGSIDRLETAVMRIGLSELHNMAAAMSLFAAFRNRGEMLVAFHDRAVVTGAIANRLAKASGDCQPSVAFTCGLLSEIGAMACLSVEGKAYSELFRSAENSLVERCLLERERYGGSSYLIGGRFLERHRLPENVCIAVATEADAEPANLEALPRLLLLARYASVIVIHAGKTGEPAEAMVELDALPETLRGVGLDGHRLFELCLEAGAVAEQSIRSRR